VVLFADTCAMAASVLVTVQKYGSSALLGLAWSLRKSPPSCREAGVADCDTVLCPTLAGIKAEKTAMITAGSMPKGDPTWNKTANGKKVLNWLKTGADLK
jgi:hypothetical protein